MVDGNASGLADGTGAATGGAATAAAAFGAATLFDSFFSFAAGLVVDVGVGGDTLGNGGVARSEAAFFVDLTFSLARNQRDIKRNWTLLIRHLRFAGAGSSNFVPPK